MIGIDTGGGDWGTLDKTGWNEDAWKSIAAGHI